MTITINQKHVVLSEETMSLHKLLVDQGYVVDNVVVSINNHIIQKNDYQTTNINEGDALDILAFVGGG